MLSILIVRRLPVAAALAIASCGLLPAPHLHADDVRSIVHQHTIAGPVAPHDTDADDHDHAVLEHGDHATAGTLAQSYDVAARFTLTAATVGVSVAVAPPAGAAILHLSAAEIRPTHDPPLRFTSSPAPPAVV